MRNRRSLTAELTGRQTALSLSERPVSSATPEIYDILWGHFLLEKSIESGANGAGSLEYLDRKSEETPRVHAPFPIEQIVDL